MCSLLAATARDVIDALLMTATSELSVKEFVQALAASVLIDETAREHDDIGIVVFADEVSNLRLPYETSTDALMLVK